ncbi:BTB/POZ domain-containing protein 6-like isoform X3 [Ruditapes philippinarum]|uniref:BTB/POZ domain-containing protein 6-like isoform X3 n=1 Tax=Ruditapes philippinarum TaxID=129788 RepID=UPI00295AEFC8|nr:BTB/POZ domain-containing protein 6-like isoform X3 [Ruditapes philippinarum]
MMETEETKQTPLQDGHDLVINERQKKRTERNLKGDTNYFCMSDHLADVWFAFRDVTTKLPAHKLLLSMRSEVFEAMFYGSLAESSDTIMLEDIDISTMKMVLRYMYSDDIELDVNNVSCCLYAAKKKYALYDMANKCAKFLETKIDVDTACTIYEQAKLYDEAQLATQCIDFITGNSGEVFLSKDFHTLAFESVLEIVKNDNLNGDESFIFAAVKGWGESECERKGLEVTSGNLRSCIGEIIFMIRFSLMPIDVFAKEVEPTGILTTEELLMIYHHLAVKTDDQEVQNVGKFSCSKRAIIKRFDKMLLNPYYQECVLALSVSKTIHLVAIHGDFVPHVDKVNFSLKENECEFDTKGEKLILREPIIISARFGKAQIRFHMNSSDGLNSDKTKWSVAKVNISSEMKSSTVYITRIPCTLRALVFKET